MAESARSLGFTHVYRYTPGKDGWLTMGLPTEGPEAATPRRRCAWAEQVKPVVLRFTADDVVAMAAD